MEACVRLTCWELWDEGRLSVPLYISTSETEDDSSRPNLRGTSRGMMGHNSATAAALVTSWSWPVVIHEETVAEARLEQQQPPESGKQANGSPAECV